MLRRKNRSLVGLDIGSSAVKAVELRRSGDSYSLVAAGVEPLPHESFVGGSIVEARVVSDAIRRLHMRLKVKTKDVAVSLSGHAAIVKKIAIPPMPREELSDSIQREARQHIPFDSHDVTLDYQVLVDAGASSINLNVVQGRRSIVYPGRCDRRQRVFPGASARV